MKVWEKGDKERKGREKRKRSERDGGSSRKRKKAGDTGVGGQEREANKMQMKIQNE